MNTVAEQLKDHRVEHLILLVGTNPLPNYVAARLLVDIDSTDHKVWLVCSKATDPIAKQIQAQLKRVRISTDIYGAWVEESSPSEIQRAILTIAGCVKGRAGLHYTGGTKAMSVHAYLALKHWAEKTQGPKPVFSYLDARHVRLVIDSGNADGTDAHIPIDLAMPMTVTEIATLHEINFKTGSPISDPWLLDAAVALQKDFEEGQIWRKEWLNVKGRKDSDPIPHSEFIDICAPFRAMGAADNSCLDDWANNAKVSTKELKSWLNGGWLESVVLKVFKDISETCQLHDSGMSYKPLSKQYDPNDPAADKFEFDVAATRGHQMFAVSCTTADKDSVCKGKLFQAFVRAKQLGGDEAKVALACYNASPQKLQRDFESDNYSAKGSICIFGKDDMNNLHECLEHWIHTARD